MRHPNAGSPFCCKVLVCGEHVTAWGDVRQVGGRQGLRACGDGRMKRSGRRQGALSDGQMNGWMDGWMGGFMP